MAIHYYTAQTEADGTLRALVTQPSILATVAGILAVLIGRHPPASCEAALASIGACSTPLSMMVIGAVIYANRKELRLRLLTMQFCLLRLILIPAVVYLTLRWLEIDRVLLGTAVLMAAMPAGTTGALLAEKYGADTSYAGEVLLISTLASIVTLPIWCCLCIFI
ncbi:MAG: AEC family transporter [Oscillospiraceae bacterium]|nr:AEC family transporter [Oscillospiraceae bacterium]